MNIKMPYKVVNLWIALILVVALILNSCGQKHTPKSAKMPPPLVRPSIVKSPTTSESFDSLRDSISLFDLSEVIVDKGDTIVFVSVSDIDALPGSIDSPADSVDRLVIPSLENKKPEETRYFILSTKYRKRLLAGTGISEADSLFIYDYSNDVLLRFPISMLNTVASLSPYEDKSEALHSAGEYMLGFKINRTALTGLSDFTKTFVYIGATNPFTKGQMRPIIWEKIDPKKVPAIALKTEYAAILKGYKFSNSYNFESNGFHYYLQEYLNSESSTSFRMLVLNTENEVIVDDLHYETESSSPAPISVLNNSKNMLEQWTGHLLKNRPPVLVGFDYISFGCPMISFVDKSHKHVDLNCDNRH